MIEILVLLLSPMSDLRTTRRLPSASTSVNSASDSSLAIPIKTRPATVATTVGR